MKSIAFEIGFLNCKNKILKSNYIIYFFLNHQVYLFQLKIQELNMTIKSINVRNQIKGTIQEIVKGDVVSEVDVVTASGIFTSVITTRSVDELDLQVGSQVIVLIKSTDVSLAKL